MKNLSNKNQKGFTLIELLVVIGILAILLAIVLIAINPARQFAQANNTNRANAVTQILNAIHAYAADNKGNLPATITTSAKQIASGGANADLCSLLVPTYISALPTDPSLNTSDVAAPCPASYTTEYYVSIDSNTTKRVTVTANKTVDTSTTGTPIPSISVTR